MGSIREGSLPFSWFPLRRSNIRLPETICTCIGMKGASRSAGTVRSIRIRNEAPLTDLTMLYEVQQKLDANVQYFFSGSPTPLSQLWRAQEDR